MNDQATTRTRAAQRSRAPDAREREISEIVGRNMRTLRILASMSQSALAEKLGITFQQVQKYETGANRVSAPKLVLMADIFNTSISAFFNDVDGLSERGDGMPAFGKHGIRAARLVDAMPPKVQGAALRVLQSLGED